MVPLNGEDVRFTTGHSADNELQIDREVNHVSCLQGSALKRRWRQVDGRASMCHHGGGSVGACACVVNRRVHNEGSTGQMRLLSVAQREAHAIAGRGRRHVIVHHLQGFRRASTLSGKEQEVVVLLNGPRLDVSNGDESNAAD